MFHYNRQIIFSFSQANHYIIFVVILHKNKNKSSSTHRDGHIDTEIPVVSKQLGDAGVEDEAVRVENGR